MRAGKTTVGKIITDSWAFAYDHLWQSSFEIIKEIGFAPEQQGEAYPRGGMDGLYRFMMPFDAYAIRRVLEGKPQGVLELGAPQSVLDDPELFAQAQQTLLPFRNVVLLIPAPDREESFRILESREEKTLINGKEIAEYFVTQSLNAELAKHTVYTKGKTPERTGEEMLSLVDPSGGNIVLIGPMGTGKSTLGALLANRLNRPRVSVDDVRFEYYKEIGWDQEVQNKIGSEEGFIGIYRYWKPFELHAIERILSDHQDSVVDFGAGHSVYDLEEHADRARRLLAPLPNVFLIQPSPDPRNPCRSCMSEDGQHCRNCRKSLFHAALQQL